MPSYAIGDIQGCYAELRRLLDQLAFDPEHDRIWLVGDLVNRGPQSLEVLRFVRSLGEAAIVVLGNHDLHLLAVAAGNTKHSKKSTLDAVLEAPDRDDLLHWLRHQPLLHHDPTLALTMVHAGLPPQWDLDQARRCAGELESVLRSDDYRTFLREMYGNRPSLWSAELSGMERLRFITNCLTRLRYCEPDGGLALKEKGLLGSQSPGRLPWFQMPGRRTRGDRIVFGHWSTLGYWSGENVWAIDSGCLWGGTLSALTLDQDPMRVIQLDCPGALTPGEA
ncbi:symmetrical bis(5'-nucleosyl)-tetraphosphatase [Thiorhodococcus mannitoliphagus]|uniref:Bis(5'-nucleosyl)-tetraphosphatase, symmetrical n=1 Tax=Thiorhodococcus mannitoliphagus TaxID=329406 RepID=A0A6P1DQ18_9GAMM|nr:symmetrical bis(5'-nucleosyl)-tetraphosphatase [Thiorhodococcus mannitoliphagus]NEX20367.1 symmetrical bis(5'-nucleosyl)-tetraphosphatase [Thiorhodococcus mannitoliphagus]